MSRHPPASSDAGRTRPSGGLDLFVDEDIEYAHRLIDAGVSTELVVVPGGFHGFDIFARDKEVVKRFTAAKVHALRAAFRMAGR